MYCSCYSNTGCYNGLWSNLRPVGIANVPYTLNMDRVAGGDLSEGIRDQVAHTF
jgi:hypothetical protein